MTPIPEERLPAGYLSAQRVYFGSYEPEWILLTDGVAFGFWSEYADGPLPNRFERCK